MRHAKRTVHAAIVVAATAATTPAQRWWLGGVGRRTCDQRVASSTPGRALPGYRCAGKPSRYITSHLGQLSLPSLRGR